MKINRRFVPLATMLIMLIATLAITSARLRADSGNCSGVITTIPFTDVASSPFFCQIAAAYFSGLTNGTSATSFSPAANVTREQMAAFSTRTLDQSLRRGSRRAALDQFWTTQGFDNLGFSTVGSLPLLVKSDGADLWVASGGPGGTVSRVRASDGKLLETWTGADNAYGVLVAMGKIFVTANSMPGKLYRIDPTQPSGTVTTVSMALGNTAQGIAYDGKRIWTTNRGGSVSIINLNPVTVTNVTSGFGDPAGILYDGANIWVTDDGDNLLKKLDSNGAILQSVLVGPSPVFPVFDGINIWVPNFSNTVSVVRVKDAAGNPLTSPFVLATLTGNGLGSPVAAAFDGERILVTNSGTAGVSLWRAADLNPIGTFALNGGSVPFGACSDGLNFWITLNNSAALARF